MTDNVWKRLLKTKCGATCLPNKPGVYALFLKSPSALPGIEVSSADSPLYIGMTRSSLNLRDHFGHQHSGFSTLRRSLGAILKQQLKLRAIPRAKGSSRSNVTNYRF